MQPFQSYRDFLSFFLILLEVHSTNFLQKIKAFNSISLVFYGLAMVKLAESYNISDEA